MLNLKKVAVTGAIASGKTTVCCFFQELGAYVVSADKIVHQLLSLSTDIGKQVVSLLGEDSVVGGELNREVIAQKVFRDPSLLEQLEKRIHPHVQKVIEAQYQAVSQDSYPLFVVEIPLLFESEQDKDYDVVIVVTAEKNKCRERFMRSTRHSEDEFDRRSNRLFPLDEKLKKADFVIYNDDNLDKLRQQVITIFNSLKEPL